ncbi:tRNA 2-selenouridine(34) synthase MnmH [Jinshanibacter sp. LJY008]|uniref:tRNA 2-selenouridine synthase n=1 Tax=Limnobaculum eriocheiris TaxID=2897391 RepID=A0A9X1MW42_9GAMM|nr:tRNA 2-selenouridine(34) synthase MnmH [Limnobaculum eriocheiris]MCD1126059.1 tRNA 2-selenouridine(34) synthase MnmH [Limnobaculum eriocheiris]
MSTNSSADYQQIFLHDIPLIDVRAPVEFAQGAFTYAANLPLMTDEERQAVGICYKQQGQKAAIELGEQLVSGDVREQRIAQWRTFCQQNPQGFLYCLRGGLRSHITQQWLKQTGIDYPLVKGGYKAMRNFLIKVNQQVATMPLKVVGGNTGSGKTRLVKALPFGIDLEGAARHRGSSFGRTLESQSTQINFENRVAVSLLKQQHQGICRWVVEDEGKTIGSNHVPLEIYDSMQAANLVVIEDPFELRLLRLKEEYIDTMSDGFQQQYGEEDGWVRFSHYLHHGLFAIRKRLGMERYQTLLNELDSALHYQQAGQGSDKHENWLVPLLIEYYDPMYSYQLSKKSDRIIFRGDYNAVRDFLLNDNH